MEDYSELFNLIKDAIEAISKSGVIEKIPGYFQQLLDLISGFLPKVFDAISGFIAK